MLDHIKFVINRYLLRGYSHFKEVLYSQFLENFKKYEKSKDWKIFICILTLSLWKTHICDIAVEKLKKIIVIYIIMRFDGKFWNKSIDIIKKDRINVKKVIN